MKWIGNVFKENNMSYRLKNITTNSMFIFRVWIKCKEILQPENCPFYMERSANHSVVSINSHHAPLHGRLRQQTQ